MLELLTDPNVILSFLTLAALEIVLGIDNLLFVQIVASRCAPEKQMLARRVGLLLALGTRLLLLASIAWVAGLTTPIFSIDWFGPEHVFDLSWRDVILLGGGLFLLAKATTEIHHHVEGGSEATKSGKYMSLAAAIVQIAILDIVFSLDSVITAVGMADHLSVMVAAVVAAMIVMILAAGAVGRFVDEHPTVKMLCLSFLLLIGMALLGEGLHFHIPKAYLYFAIAFSALVEFLNMWARKKKTRAKG
ncbi:TerC family protein [Dongia rigui]|uniref:TerC family protein n=1 Tax=Dongia rigui TaxID=940149 RepID=A0ABU5E3L4_9PROT|nr:TerC family protein [Dongia rigui]MDY0873922.1 TerC family protein [Dongia rigui]